MQKLMPLGILAAAGLLAGCNVEQTEEGRLPDVDVDARGGELPEFDVDAPDVDVGTREAEIDVPDVDVDVDTQRETVTVPDIDVQAPENENEDR